MLTLLIGLFFMATVVLLIFGKLKNRKSLIIAGIVCGIIAIVLVGFVLEMLTFPIDSSI